MSELEKVREERLTVWQRLRNWAWALKRDVIALYYAIRNPLTPWYAKAVAIVVVGYALSPIDLIPDFVPVLGYLDDVILVPLGIALVIKLTPGEVLEQCRQEAIQKPLSIKPKSWTGAVIIVLLWLLVAYGLYKAFI
jgi:uncharacterized membrane protein YkvA (DUF1232 family)